MKKQESDKLSREGEDRVDLRFRHIAGGGGGGNNIVEMILCGDDASIDGGTIIGELDLSALAKGNCVSLKSTLQDR